MLISRMLMGCVAVGAVVLIGCRARDTAGEDQNASSATPALQGKPDVEDVYVTHATFTSENLPVTSFCDPANFPTDYPVARERYYGYWSIETRRSDGMVVKTDAEPVGGHHGCYSINKDNKIYSYMTGTFAGVPFTARGYCVFNPDRAPEPPASAAGTLPYMCNYGMSDLPEGYVRGQSTWNGITTDLNGYLTTTMGTVRLWKRRNSQNSTTGQ
jgi:hypothetical protein